MDLGFLLAFLLLFHLVPPLLGVQNYSTCSKDFKCLNLFRETESNSPQPPSCGLCMANCDANSLPKIKLVQGRDYGWFDPWLGRRFDVVDASKSNVISLQDPTFQKFLRNKNCTHFSFDEYIPYLDSKYAIVKSITIFRCGKTALSRPETVDYFLGYEKNESCGEFSIFYQDPKLSGTQPLNEHLLAGCSAIKLPLSPLYKVLNRSNLFDLLTADFDLEWLPSDECDETCHLEVSQFQEYNVRKHLCAGAEDATIDNSRKGKKNLKIITGTTVPIGGGALFAILVFFFLRQFSMCNSIEREKIQDIEIFIKNCGSLAPKRYRYSDVKKMTNSFNVKLGQGGYGSVYKGTMRDGSLVAVKILKESKRNGEEFINEVASISRTSHVNVVTLLGFCFDGPKKALIYEFMANGSLEKFIYEEKSLVNRQLEWSTLYRIAVGIARGLEYLHSGCNTRILHFDIKPHNILLDENFCPKISDFGLAKLCTRKESIISTMTARGTIGYIAPEIVCKNIGGISHKSDVYSYGMMILEMVGGRKNVDGGVDHTSEIYFPHWIYSKLRQGEELGLSGIVDEEENKHARIMLMVSLWCIQTNPSARPTISNVLEMLEGPLEALEMPPAPFLYSPSRGSPDRLT